jgi:uncharacterized protein (DUF427 family)
MVVQSATPIVVTATNSGGLASSTLSLDIIAVQITTSIAPATSALVSGQALDETTNWSTFLNPSNYASTAGTISSVVVNYIGDTPDATTDLWGGETNHFSITVTDSAANEAKYRRADRSGSDIRRHVFQFADEPERHLQRDHSGSQHVQDHAGKRRDRGERWNPDFNGEL